MEKYDKKYKNINMIYQPTNLSRLQTLILTASRIILCFHIKSNILLVKQAVINKIFI
jgi:hypothetical protein